MSITLECLDCGLEREIDAGRESVLRSRAICAYCYIQRAKDDYMGWCGAMEVEYDPESAEEYLHVTSFGSELPKWVKVRVIEFATEVDKTIRIVYSHSHHNDRS